MRTEARWFFYAMNNYLVDEPIEIRLVCENGDGPPVPMTRR